MMQVRCVCDVSAVKDAKIRQPADAPIEKYSGVRKMMVDRLRPADEEMPTTHDRNTSSSVMGPCAVNVQSAAQAKSEAQQLTMT